MSKKEVVVKQETAIVESGCDNSGWGASDFSASDLVIPKILPQQGMSKLVMEGTARFGEFRDSINGTLLGSIDKPLEFIPFHVEKVWVESKDIDGRGKFEFSGIVPITRANEGLPKEGLDEHNRKVKRDFTYYVYVLLPSEVKEGSHIPYILSFKRTSRRAGQKVMTQMYMRNKLAGKNPAATVMLLEGKKTQNENGTWITLDVKPLRPSSNEEQQSAFEMLKLVQGGKVKVDHESEVTQDKQHVRDDVEF